MLEIAGGILLAVFVLIFFRQIMGAVVIAVVLAVVVGAIALAAVLMGGQTLAVLAGGALLIGGAAYGAARLGDHLADRKGRF